MNRRVAFPFRTLSESAIQAPAWSIQVDRSTGTISEDFIPDWDCSSSIRLQRDFSIDHSIAVANLGISTDELFLRLGVRIGTGQGRLPRLLVQTQAHELRSPDWQASVELEMAGEQLSSVLDIYTELTVARKPSNVDPLAPSRLGDRVWHDRTRLRLEGEEPRFPIEVGVLWAVLGDATAASAPWYLHWSPRDWSRDFHGAIRLYLNPERSEIITRIEQQDPPTIQVLMADVMAQVCERLVTDPEAEEIVDRSEPGSLGAQAAAWLQRAWPGRDITFVRTLLGNRPGAFRAALLALAEPRET